VKVNDTGVGIKGHNKDKLFQQFQQFDKNQLQSGGGSGLGLWISHFIVDCHGGNLQFESIGLGKGSVFFFDLPLYREQNKSTVHPKVEMAHWPTSTTNTSVKIATEEGDLDEENTGPSAEVEAATRAALADSHPRPHKTLTAPSTPTAPSGRLNGSVTSDDHTDSAVTADGMAPKQVAYLLVDDSKGNRRMLRRMLESDKSIPVSSVQEAEDGVDAVKIVAGAGSALDKPPIDCIFMDSVMNQMHGPETVKHLRSKLGFTGKILGLTGNAMEDDVKHFKEAGLDLLLIKPLKKAALLEALLVTGLIPTQPALSQPPSGGLAAAAPAAEDSKNGDA
jgi:CheY-like chemotaxis protein